MCAAVVRGERDFVLEHVLELVVFDTFLLSSLAFTNLFAFSPSESLSFMLGYLCAPITFSYGTEFTRTSVLFLAFSYFLSFP